MNRFWKIRSQDSNSSQYQSRAGVHSSSSWTSGLFSKLNVFQWMKTPTQENTSTSFELIKFEKNGNNFSTLEDGPPFNRHVSGSHTRNQQNESQKLVYDDDGGREEPDVINKVPDLSKNAFVDTTTPNGTSILLDIKQEVIEDDNDADLYEVDTNGNPVATIRVPLDIWNQLILKPVKQETLDEPPPEASNVAPSASVHVPTDETPVSTVRCGLKRKNPTLASSSEVTKKTEEPVTKKVYRRNQFKAGHKLRQNQTLRHTSQKCAFCEKVYQSQKSLLTHQRRNKTCIQIQAQATI